MTPLILDTPTSDEKVAQASFLAGAKMITTKTYYLGYQLRTSERVHPSLNSVLDTMRDVFLKRYHALIAFQKRYPQIVPVIDLHGSGTSPYRGPHGSIHWTQQYHNLVIEKCLNHVFPKREMPLLYQAIPTLEEACSIAYVCRENNWKVVISMYVTKNPSGEMCLQTKQGALIPILTAIGLIEQVADTSQCWYAFNCFDPRCTADLIQTLRSSSLWPRMRGICPNLSDPKNDLNYTPLWDDNTESLLASWNPPGDAMPAFIGACCGSTPAHISRLHALLNETK